MKSKKIVICSITILTVCIALCLNIGYKTNENGETYGRMAHIADPTGIFLMEVPDLIAVMATNGKSGYVKKDDFVSEIPKNPEEALNIQEDSFVKSIPVYKNDGITVIGEFQFN